MKECPEFQLLLGCAHVHLGKQNVMQIQTILQQELDWDFLQQIALQHGVIPLLYWNLKQTCSEAVPALHLSALQALFQANAQQNVLLVNELIRLFRLFQENQIPILPFKGPMLAIINYGNLALRQIVDLDILVNEQEIEKAKLLLINQGYELRIKVPWEMHLIRQNGFYNVDLHNTIVPQHLSHPLRSEDIWQQIEQIQFAGTTLYTLSPEMNLLVLCLHGTKDCWNRLCRICDISELIHNQSIDWQIVIERANTQGWRRLIGLGLVLARDLLDTELPEEVERWIKTEPFVDKLATQVKQQLFCETTISVDEVERTLFHIRTRERLRDKFWALWGLMIHSGWFAPTSNDRDFIKLPPVLAFLYYLIRPIRVLGKYWRVIQGYFT